jgi:hypothetical protein
LIGLLNISVHPTLDTETAKISTQPDNLVNCCNFDTVKSDLSQYLWPTDASDRITSSFAEYRTKHFHGGIDISTNGQTGYKVFSVREGYVERIWITPNGYGKMLYIKHSDGYVSTYAHLKSFSKKIDDIVSKEQYRNGTYAINLQLEPNSVPVDRGEVIAYTGDTGFGPPHLHFELRDENLNPINPLLISKYNIPDNLPPFIRRVVVSPLSYNSMVNYDGEPKFFSRIPKRSGLYIIPQTIRIHGDVGFGIDAEDRSNGNWRETGIYRMKFYIDDSLIYSMELNRIPQLETKQIDLHYDLPFLLEGLGRFQKLYISDGNSLPFYNHQPNGTGIIHTDRLKEGEHNYKILVADIQGNESELRGKIFANHTPKIDFSDFDLNHISISSSQAGSINQFVVSGKRAFQTNWSTHSLNRSRFSARDSIIDLPINLKPYDVVRVVAETETGSRSNPLYHFVKKTLGPPRTIFIDWKIISTKIIITVTTSGVFTEPPQVIIQEGPTSQTIAVNAIDLSKYEGIFVPSTSYQGVRNLKVAAEVNGKPSEAESNMSFFVISPKISGEFSSLNGGIKISYDSASVYTPLIFNIEQQKNNRSTIYLLTPTNILLHGGIKASLPLITQDQKTGIYFRLNGGWVFQSSTVDSNTNALSAILTRTLGDISLLRDENPPSFGRIKVSAPKGYLNISFRYYDNLSGVDTDEIKMYIDDVPIIPEIDGEHHRAFYYGNTPISKGKHQLRISIKDKVKNSNEYARSLVVK